MRIACGTLFFFILILPCAVSGLCMLAINTWVFDRDFYTDVLDNETLYAAIVDSLPENLEVDTYQRTDFSVAQRDQANQALAMAFSEVIPPDYLREETLRVVDEFFTLLEAENFDIEIAMNLVPIREAILNEQSEAFAQTLAANLPACEAGQEPRDPGDPLIGCLSSNMTQVDAIESITNSLPSFAESIPNEFVINEVDTADVDSTPVDIRIGYNLGMSSLLVIAFLLWLVVAFIAAKGQRQLFLWLGGMLLIPAFIIAMLGASMRLQWVSNLDDLDYTVNGEPASEEYVEALQDVFETGLVRVGDGFILVGGMAGGVAAILLLLGYYSPRRDDFDDFYGDDKPKRVTVG